MNLHTRALSAEQREDVRRLYLALDRDSTYKRFGSSLSAETVSRYIDRLDMADGVVLGAYDGESLVGVCEALPFYGEDGIRELAFVVAPGYQGQQVGLLLGMAVLRATADRLVVACMAENAPMSRLASRLGFRRVGRGNPGALPAGLVDELYTPHGLFAGRGQLVAA